MHIIASTWNNLNATIKLSVSTLVCALALTLILGESLNSELQRAAAALRASKQTTVALTVLKPLLALESAAFAGIPKKGSLAALRWGVPEEAEEILKRVLLETNHRALVLGARWAHESATIIPESVINELGTETLQPTEYESESQIRTIAENEKTDPAIVDSAVVVASAATERSNAVETVFAKVSKQINEFGSEPMVATEPPAGSASGSTETLATTAAAAVNASKMPAAGKIRIAGTLSAEAESFPGHFEVGFYRAIGSNGIPVGAPSPQAILQIQQRQFVLEVPRAAKGFLFARYIGSESGKSIREWHGYPQLIDLADLVGEQIALQIPINRATYLAGVKSSSEKKENIVTVRGRVLAMFAKGNAVAVGDTVIRARGTTAETRSAADGSFALELRGFEGKLVLEYLRGGFAPVIEEVEVDKGKNILDLAPTEIPSLANLQKLAQSVGVRMVSASSILILGMQGRYSNSGIPGASVELNLKGEGPFYFSDKGLPQAALKSTTMDGRAIYFNVSAGVATLESYVLGEPLAPTMISALGAGEVQFKRVALPDRETKVTGRVLDPVSNPIGAPLPIAGARVRIVGSDRWTETDSLGAFELPQSRFAKNSDIVLEMSRRGFYNHRFVIRNKSLRREQEDLTLYAFPQIYLNRLAKSVDVQLDPNKGMIIGSVGHSERLRIDTLLDHSDNNEARDFYFDAHNLIQGTHAYTEPGFGTYAIFNVSPGRALIHGYGTNGVLRYGDLSFISASTISIVVWN